MESAIELNFRDPLNFKGFNYELEAANPTIILFMVSTSTNK